MGRLPPGDRVSALRSTPYRADQDKGDQSNYAIFSDGPYKLEGTWKKGMGGTFVRNTNWDPKTDSTSVRKALPDKIVFTEGLTNEIISQRLIADSGNDKFAVTDRRIPPRSSARSRATRRCSRAPPSWTRRSSTTCCRTSTA